MNEQLEANVVRTDYAYLKEVEKSALEKLNEIREFLSDDERNYIKSTITKKAIPTVQLLVKDHKQKKKPMETTRRD